MENVHQDRKLETSTAATSRKQSKRCRKKEHQTRLTFRNKYQLEDDDDDLENESRTIVIDQRTPETHHHSIETILLEVFQDVHGHLPQIEDSFAMPDKCFHLVRFTDPLAVDDVHRMNVHPKMEQLGLRFVSVPVSWMDRVLVKYQPVIDQFHEFFHPQNQPDGLTVIDDFIDQTEETSLIEFIQASFQEALAEQKVCHLKNRDAIHFGRAFDYGRNTITDDGSMVFRKQIPEIFQTILDRFVAGRHVGDDERPDQLTVNRYDVQRGDHIPLHCDTHSMCTETILSLSLASDVVMTWKRMAEHASTILPARSLMIMSGESRYTWKHGILKTTADLIPVMLSCNRRRLAMRPRRQRFSLSFRKSSPPGYQCKCKECAMNVVDANPDWDAPILESNYVHQTYDSIAGDFSSTRYKCWPEVARFLQSLPRGSLVLDVGCGNGRFLTAADPSIFVMGTDRSIGMLQICRQRNLETFLDDCLNVDRTLRPGIFDAVISIAVVHHLASEERRHRAVHALFNLLAMEGCALIYVWAFEQNLAQGGGPTKYLNRKETTTDVECEKIVKNDQNVPSLMIHRNRTEFQRQDLLVPWTKTTNQAEEYFRYYHVFAEGELERLIKRVAEKERRYRLEMQRCYYDEGNWCAVVKKLPPNVETD